MNKQNSVETLIADIASESVALRKQLHQVPELAGEEFQTSLLLRQALSPLHITILPPFLQTDVVVLLLGHGPGSCVLLRADIDALPTADGLRHACGHDGHAAILWGAIKVLSMLKDSWSGTVVGVFQPGEEIKAMASDLVDAGLLRQYPPDFAYALHGWPGISENDVQTRNGAIMAAAGFFRFVLRGCGGHGSRPDEAINPLVAAARLVKFLSRKDRHNQPVFAQNCRDQTVVSVCRVQGGTNANTIPDEAVVEGTTRYLNVDDGVLVRQFLDQAAEKIRSLEKVQVTLDYRTPYPPTINDRAAVERIRAGTRAIVPAIRWHDLAESAMASDDFAYYIDKLPGAYLHLGLGEAWPALHSLGFEFNDKVIATGITLLVGAVLEPSRSNTIP